MRKFIPLMLLVLFACTTRTPEPKNAQTLDEALQLAQKLNRPVLIDFMTDW